MNSRNTEIIIQKSHFGTVKIVSFSHDGTCLAVVPFEGSIDFRDIQGRLVARRLLYNGSVGWFQWHPSENRFLAASYDGKVILRDVHGEVYMSLDHGACLNSMSIRADGTAIVTEGNGAVRLWDTGGALIEEIAEGREDIRRAGFLHDGKVFYLEGEDVLNVVKSGGEVDRIVKYPPGGVESFEAGRDGAIFLAMSEGLFCAGECDEVFSCLYKAQEGVCSVRLNPDGNVIAAAHADGAVVMLNRSGEVIRELAHQSNTVLDLSWTPDGKYLATGCADGGVRLYDSEGSLMWELHGNYSMIRGFRLENDGAFTPFAKKESMYDSLGVPGDVRDFLLGHATILPVGSIAGVGIMPEGGVMAAWDDSIQIYESGGAPGIRIRTGGDHINCALLSDDGKYIAAGCSCGAVFFWNVQGELLGESSAAGVPVIKSAWNSKERLWAVSRMQPESVVELFDTSGVFIRTISCPGNEVSALAFSNDGEFIMSGSRDGLIHICGLNGEACRQLRDPDDAPVHAVAMGTDGRVFTGSGTGAVRIWEGERCSRTILPKDENSADVQGIVVLSNGAFVCGYINYLNDKIETMITIRDKNGKLLKKISLSNMSYGIEISMAVNENSGCIAVAMINRVTLLNFNGDIKGTIKTADARITAMEINAAPEVSLIVSGFEDGTLELRGFTGDVIACTELKGGAVNAIALSGNRILTATADALVYSLSTDGELLTSFQAGNNITAMALCPDEDSVALGFGDGSIGIYSITGELMRTVPGDNVYNVPVKLLFSHDGAVIAAGYARGDIIVYDINGIKVSAFQGFSILQNILAFHNSGNFLLFGNVDLSIVAVDVRSGGTVFTIVPEGEEYLVYTPGGEYDYSVPELAELVAFSDGENIIYPDSGAGKYVPGLIQRIFGQG